MSLDRTSGGKITSLKDEDGREYLAQAEPGFRGPQNTATFTQGAMCGWDECAPSIDEVTVGDWHIPDHGDLWSQSFAVSGNTMSARGTSMPYSFHRTASASHTGIDLAYEVTSEEGELPFLWAAHPQFIAPPGVRLLLEHPAVLNVSSTPPAPLPWSPEMADVSALPAGSSAKYYVAPETPSSWATLEYPWGVSLTLRWSTAAPYLGIWLDNAEFSREPVIALEPSTGFYDRLDRAMENDRVSRVSPGSPLKWSIDISLTKT
jgi:hypothetical protein